MERRSEEKVEERRRRWIQWGAIGLLLLGGLYPVGWVDRLTATAVGWLSIPDRFASRLGSLAFGAGLESDPQRLALARESAADLQRRELSSAIAGKEELRQRGGIVASVERREVSDATYEINRGLADGVIAGQAVTLGDTFAGVVASSKEHRATVYFPWHRGVRVCARTIEEQSSRVVVTGSGEGTMRVLVSQQRPLREGVEVEVAASADANDVDAAIGFRIGIVKLGLEGLAPGVEVDPNIRADRLLQVIVRTPAPLSADEADSTPSHWEAIRLFADGDATPYRRSSLATEPDSGARLVDGGALELDQWLIGRVARIGGGAARVRFVEDPGFTFSAILLGNGGPPLPMRRLRTLASSSGAVTFAAVDGLLGVGPEASGVLVTGAGDPNVPKGLRIGRARVVSGRVVVERDFAGGDARAAFALVLSGKP